MNDLDLCLEVVLRSCQRQRTHNLTLPTDGNPLMKQNFVYRMVFKDIYWFF